jgi:hypothetical protein
MPFPAKLCESFKSSEILPRQVGLSISPHLPRCSIDTHSRDSPRSDYTSPSATRPLGINKQEILDHDFKIIRDQGRQRAGELVQVGNGTTYNFCRT